MHIGIAQWLMSCAARDTNCGTGPVLRFLGQQFATFRGISGVRKLFEDSLISHLQLNLSEVGLLRSIVRDTRAELRTVRDLFASVPVRPGGPTAADLEVFRRAAERRQLLVSAIADRFMRGIRPQTAALVQSRIDDSREPGSRRGK